jgi:hypothetical protein
MIAVIGVMIGFYILTRCACIGDKEPMLARILSMITFVITILAIVYLMLAGSFPK